MQLNWDNEKAKKILDLTDLALWGKTFAIGIRCFLIIAVVVSFVFGIGYWYALKKRPIVPVDFSYYLASGKTVRARLNGDWLQIDKHGMAVTDKDGKIIKRITVADVPILSKKLKPYGLKNNLIGYYGAGFTMQDVKIEAGGGIEFAYLWDFNLGLIVTNKAGYCSVSYPMKKILIFELDNTAIVGATGYNYDGERQHSVGLRVKF